jgi:hypothetical protein
MCVVSDSVRRRVGEEVTLRVVNSVGESGASGASDVIVLA